EILDFIATSPSPVGKREIARAFNVAPTDRVALKALLREIAHEDTVERARGRRLQATPALPEIAVVEITAIDLDGEVTARPLVWRGAEAPPRIVVRENRLGADEVGQRVAARLT